MDAKEFLGQVKKLDKLIENKSIERQQWKSLATSTTAQMGGERVQSSGNQQKMANAVHNYVDIEREIYKCIDDFIDAKQGVVSVIEQLDAKEYDLLHKVYIQYYTLAEVAMIYERTERAVAYQHRKAIASVQKILDNR